jgi:sulfite reductase (NADPH) flavoprotein alpha-component
MHADITGSHSAKPPGSQFSRQNPFLAELTRHDRLTRPGSNKDTRHFVLNLAGSGLRYTPGDSLGAFAQNSPALVAEIIDLLGFDPIATVADPRGKTVPLRDTLRRDFTLNRANRKIIAGLTDLVPDGPQRTRLLEIANDTDQLADYIDTRDYVDILKEFSSGRFPTPESFLSCLSPITPRLYSIASSFDKHPGEAHLCVEIVRYETHGRPKKGLASGFLADHTETFLKNIPVYVQESRTFRLPPDPARDIIMIGPGTGIAPFRAFLEQRIHDGAIGRNWLFFGEQHRATDFLYEEELLDYRHHGKLHRLDLAFSRDQDHKIYVQHKMREHAMELWSWIAGGAYIYVCGDARHMAKDVHQTLIDIVREQGGMTKEAASDYVNTGLMKSEKRYLRDIY